MGRAAVSWRVPGARTSSISLREYGMTRAATTLLRRHAVRNRRARLMRHERSGAGAGAGSGGHSRDVERAGQARPGPDGHSLVGGRYWLADHDALRDLHSLSRWLLAARHPLRR